MELNEQKDRPLPRENHTKNKTPFFFVGGVWCGGSEDEGGFAVGLAGLAEYYWRFKLASCF